MAAVFLQNPIDMRINRGVIIITQAHFLIKGQTDRQRERETPRMKALHVAHHWFKNRFYKGFVFAAQ